MSCKEKQKRVLVVFGHPDKLSFNGALLNTAVNHLETKGYKVEVSDLHEQDFDPRANRSDVLHEKEINVPFNYNEESGKAYRLGTLSDERSSEMTKLEKADLVIFQFPLYFSSAPAVIKGWLDKVLVNGFAYNFEAGNMLEKGLMKGKRAILSITTGGSKAALSSVGLNGDINVALWHIQYGALRMCGFDVLRPHLSYETLNVNDETRKDYLKNWENRLEKIFLEQPLAFPCTRDFDLENTLTFKPEIVEKHISNGTMPSVAHHLGTRNKDELTDDIVDDR